MSWNKHIYHLAFLAVSMDCLLDVDKTHIRLLSLDVMMAVVVHAGVQLEDKKVTAAITVEQETVVANNILDLHGSMYASGTILLSRQQRIAYTYTCTLHDKLFIQLH